MRCPECGGKVIVKDTRKAGDEVLRKRQCLTCGAKVYTYEAIDETDYVRRRLIKIHERELKKRVISKGISKGINRA